MRDLGFGRGIAVAGLADGGSIFEDVNQLHLIHLETVSHRFERVCLWATDTRLLPFPRVRVAMVDADLVPIRQRASHPAADAERRGSSCFERKR